MTLKIFNFLKQKRLFAYEKLDLFKNDFFISGFNEKTQIFPVKNGVDYLGFRFYLTDTGKVIRRLRTSSKKRFKRRLKKFTKYYNEYKIGLLEITRSIASYKGHLKHGHIYKLKKKNFSNFVLTQK